MIVNRQEIAEKIVEIEQQFDVNSVKYKGIRMWPLIRVMLVEHLFFRKFSLRHRIIPTTIRLTLWHLWKVRNIFWGLYFLPSSIIQRLHQKQLEKIRQNGPIDVLFISRVQDHNIQFRRQFHDRYIDPMIDLVRGKYRFLKLELTSKRIQNTFPRFEPTTFISPTYYFTMRSPLRRRLGNPTIENFTALNEVVSKVFHITLPQVYIIARAELGFNYQGFFTEVLSILRPKAVFIEEYYDPVAMGLSRASKSLGVKAVELQHGTQGKYSIFNSHWTKIPEDGYELLPDFFWVWGQESRENIQKWYPVGCHHHRPVVGGNRWTGKWIDDEYDYDIRSEAETFWRMLQTASKVILVTLGSIDPVHELLPAHFLETMKRAPADWFWLIRLHPLSFTSKEEIRVYLERQGGGNYEIDYATSLPLYALLKCCDHLITCFSSTGYEALAFHVPVTLIHPIGFKTSKNYVKRGLFRYAQSAEALLQSIQQPYPNGKPEEPTSYIETSKQCAEAALNAIMAGSKEPTFECRDKLMA